MGLHSLIQGSLYLFLHETLDYEHIHLSAVWTKHLILRSTYLLTIASQNESYTAHYICFSNTMLYNDV
jgi:hypothetical protein